MVEREVPIEELEEEVIIKKKRAPSSGVRIGSPEFREAVKDVKTATSIKKAYKEGAELVSQSEYDILSEQAASAAAQGKSTKEIWLGEKKTAPIKLKTKELEKRVYETREEIPFGKPYGTKKQPWEESMEEPIKDIPEESTLGEYIKVVETKVKEASKTTSCDLQDVYKKAKHITSTKVVRESLTDEEKEMENKLKQKKADIKDANMEQLFSEYDNKCIESKEGIDVSCCVNKKKKASKTPTSSAKAKQASGLLAYNQCYLKWCQDKSNILVSDKAQCKSKDVKAEFYEPFKKEWRDLYTKGCPLDEATFMLPKIGKEE